jgi:NDP-sugar pyrophosphorylase family protein
MSKRIHLIIPAAGLGSRFADVGINIPKPLIEVHGIPMLVWVILNFPLATQDKIWIIGQTKHKLKATLDPWLVNLPQEIRFLEIDTVTEGPAQTVALALQEIPDFEGVIVANSDQYISCSIDEFVGEIRRKVTPGSIITMEAASNAWSYVGRNAQKKVDRVIEKVEISDEATVGIYGWSESHYLKDSLREMFMHNIKTNNEFYVAPSYNHLISIGLEISTFHVGKHGKSVHGLGTPSDLENFHADSSKLLVAQKLKKSKSSI